MFQYCRITAHVSIQVQSTIDICKKAMMGRTLVGAAHRNISTLHPVQNILRCAAPSGVRDFSFYKYQRCAAPFAIAWWLVDF